MRADLLKRGVALLRADAANPQGVKFNLGTWAEPDDKDKITDSGIVTKYPSGWGPDHDAWAQGATVPVSCGTQACAMGLFAISGEFEDEGLGYTITAGGHLFPAMHGHDGFAAAVRLFDISESDAMYLFDPDYYGSVPEGEAGEKLVTQRIEDFIAGTIDEHYHPDFRDSDDYDDD